MKFIFSFYAPHMKANTYWQTLQVNKLVIDFSEIYEIIQ